MRPPPPPLLASGPRASAAPTLSSGNRGPAGKEEETYRVLGFRFPRQREGLRASARVIHTQPSPGEAPRETPHLRPLNQGSAAPRVSSPNGGRGLCEEERGAHPVSPALPLPRPLHTGLPRPWLRTARPSSSSFLVFLSTLAAGPLEIVCSFHERCPRTRASQPRRPRPRAPGTQPARAGKPRRGLGISESGKTRPRPS